MLVLVQNLTRDLESIEKLLWAPWQQQDMIHTFLQPSLIVLTFRKNNLLVYRSYLVLQFAEYVAFPMTIWLTYFVTFNRYGHMFVSRHLSFPPGPLVLFLPKKPIVFYIFTSNIVLLFPIKKWAVRLLPTASPVVLSSIMTS